MTDKPKKEDEDAAIDFSKIKSWFKGKGAKEHAHHHTSEHAHNEEHGQSHTKQEDKDEFKVDYNSAIGFLKKYSTIFLILIPIILTIYIRLQPMYLPSTDDWAQNAVYNYYQSQISAQIDQQYPNLPDANKQALISAEFQKMLNENKDVITQQVDVTSQQFKEKMMYESGNSKYVYLGDIDSYYWLRDARKLIQNVSICDEVDYTKKLCYHDTYTSAPLKSASPLSDERLGKNAPFYSYIVAYTYRIMHSLNQDITIMQASFYVPLIIGIISSILAFLIGKALSGNLAGLVTSIFVSVNPIHLSRTLGSDNDPLNMIFPLMIVLFFIHTFQAQNIRNKVIFGCITGLSISLFAAAWQGWWYIFDFMLGTIIIYAAFILVKKKFDNKSILKTLIDKDIKNIGIVGALIILSSAIFITLVSGFATFTNFILGPLWFTQTKVAALETFWPNVLVTVAEFNPGSIDTIIAQMGGKLIFFIGLMGLLFLMTGKDKISRNQKYILAFGALIYLLLISQYGRGINPFLYMALIALPVAVGMILLLKTKEDVDVKMAILLVIWFVATTYAALKGVRFTLLMVSAFGVAFGITLASIYRSVSRWISEELKINEMITNTVIAVLLLLILISPVKAGWYTSQHYIPSVDDAWYDTLTKIKDNSKQDAIINSWWDFGHWFKYLADRRVTLDGSSQGGPPLHWLGKLMVTNDEKHSVGILRMLDCGSNTAFEKLNPILEDTSKSIEILDEIVTLDKEKAEEVLIENGLDEEETAEVLKYTHCRPPEDFFITSEDMVGKAGVWAHFGSWDFKRAEMYNRVKGTTLEEGKKILMSPEYNLTPEEADQYYYEIQTQEDGQWITTWPSYMSGVNACDTPSPDGIMICNQALSNGQQIPLAVNLTNMDVILPIKDNPKPASIVYVTPEGTEEKKFEGNLLPFSLVLIPRGEQGYSTLVTHPYLANSIFTRLFYLNGHGLRYFDSFNDQHSSTTGRIMTWKVDWEGGNQTIVYKAFEASEVIEKQDIAETNKTKKTSTKTGNKTISEQ
jgi:dolichyl-diphosphooligosaccharide--protein glycosyltransferase